MSHPAKTNTDADGAAAATSASSPLPAIAVATAAAAVQLDTADSKTTSNASLTKTHTTTTTTTPLQQPQQHPQQQTQQHMVFSLPKPCLITAAANQDEPLSLEYATTDAVPLHLRQLLSQLSGRKISAAELLVLLIYLVALESGFVEEQTYLEKRHLLKSVPLVGCFHIYNVRLLSQLKVNYAKEFEDTAFRFILRTLLNQQCSQEASVVATLQTRLMAVVLGDLLMVTLSPLPPSKEPGFSVCLSIGRFVLNVQLEPFYKRFRKLDELTLQLRQKLFQPMRAQQLFALKLHHHPSLLGLPSELYDEIFRHLNANQLNVVANVNWQLLNYSKQFKDRRQKES